MRIDDVNRPPQSQATERAQQTGSHDKQLQNSINRSDDHAELSSLAQANATGAADGADPKRLEALRLAVETGQYSVSSTDLAAKIIDGHVRA
ncbi:MAG: flagellar biosynthesis anti-sigma factor FlgM [Acidobacteriota bacterium]|nr:flagellar biosynthesis anti-sigma factor FlgM [Acidobacteriota bacterium]